MGLLPSAQAAQSQSPHPSTNQQFIPSRNIATTPPINQAPKANPVTQIPLSPKQEVANPPIAQVSEPPINLVSAINSTNSTATSPIAETPISSGNDDFENIASVGYDLDQMWQSVLSVLPTPTKSVFIQIQAHILSIDSGSIKIGLAGKRDETTKHIVVQKRPELEEVFARVLQRPIKVMFTFVNTPQQAEPVKISAPLPYSPAIAPLPPAPISQPISQPLPSPVSQNPTAIAPTVPSASTPSPAPPAPPIAVAQTKGYVGLSEDDRVVKNLAELFNGQIIDLDEEPANEQGSGESVVETVDE